MRRLSIAVAALMLVAMASVAMAGDYTWLGINTEANTDFSATDVDAAALWTDTDNTGLVPGTGDSVTFDWNDVSNDGDVIWDWLVVYPTNSFNPDGVLQLQTQGWVDPHGVPLYILKNLSLQKVEFAMGYNVGDPVNQFIVGSPTAPVQLMRSYAGTAFARWNWRYNAGAGSSFYTCVSWQYGGVIKITGKLGTKYYRTTAYTSDAAFINAVNANQGATGIAATSSFGYRTMGFYSLTTGTDGILNITNIGCGADGQPGVVGVDDDSNGTTDDPSEAGWPGSDDVIDDTNMPPFEHFGQIVASTVTFRGLAPQATTLDLTGENPVSFTARTDGWNVIDLLNSSTLKFSNAAVTLKQQYQAHALAQNYGYINGENGATVEFSDSDGTVNLADPGNRAEGTLPVAGNLTLKVNAAQTWNFVDSDGNVINDGAGLGLIRRSVTANGVLVTSADASPLNNLDNVAFFLDLPQVNQSYYFPAGEYQGIITAGAGTSGRLNTIVMTGDIGVMGYGVRPRDTVLTTATAETEFGLVLDSHTQVQYILDMDGYDLTVAKGMKVDCSYTGASYLTSTDNQRYVDAAGSTLNVQGNLAIHAGVNYAGFLNAGALAEFRRLGISGDASTVINLGGNFTTNARAMRSPYAGLTTATVNVLGGDTDGAVTWEVTADPTTVAFGAGTGAIGVMNIGASGDPAVVQLVNDNLNDNDELNVAKTKDGEVLLVSTLNIVNGTLDLNGLGATVSSATLSISTDGTLDLHSGQTLTPGVPYMKFAGLGDQTAAWNGFKAQVVDSTPGNETLTFEAVYNSGDDKTYWSAKGAPTGIVSDASLVTAAPGTIRNNGTDVSTITIYLVDTGGYAITGLTAGDFVITAGSATVTFVGETDPGVSGIYTAQLTSTTVATETVVVTVNGTELSTQPTVNVVLPIPAKTPSTLTLSRTEVNDSGTIPATITVYLQDQYGSNLLGVAGSLSLLEDGIDTGLVFTEIGNGQYTTTYVGSVAGVYSLQAAFDFGGANEVILDGADTKTMTVYTPGTGIYPLADAGGDQDVDAVGAAADVILDASLSYDDVGIARYAWTYAVTGQTLYSGTDSVVTLSLGVGVHQLLLTVTDDDTLNGVTAADHSDAQAITVTVGVPANDSVQLDISSGFNIDAFAGPKETKALFQYNVDFDPNRTMQQVQGTAGFHNPASPGVGWNMWENYSADIMVGNSQTEAYNLAGTTYMLMSMGTREQGIIAGSEMTYHMASYVGNATLPGNWLEVANPQAPTYGATSYYTVGADGQPGVVDVDDDSNGTVDDASELGWPGSDDVLTYNAFPTTDLMLTKGNAMIVGASHDRNSWQIADITATLPVGQQATYQSVNFVLMGFSTYPGRNMQIRVIYEDDSEETIWAFDYLATPISTTADASVPADYTIVQKMIGRFTHVNGNPTLYTTGTTRRLYELTTSLPLSEPGLKIKAIRLVDAIPTTQWASRGAAIFAASAIPSPEPTNIVDADESSVAIDPLTIPNDNTTPATLTLTLRDANRMRVTGLTAGDFSFLVAGTGTTTVDNFQDLGNGIYTFDVKSDTAGMKDILVTADGTDLSAVASVDVYSAPVADAGPDQTIDATSSYMLVSLDASASYDAEGSIVSYKWQTSDGAVLYNGTDAMVQVALAAPGAYDLTLTVTNDAPAPGPYTGSDVMNVAISALTYTTEAIALDSDAANIDAFGTPEEVTAANTWYAYWILNNTDVVQNGKTYGSWVDTPPVDSWTVGPDGQWGVATVDDDANGTVDDASEAGWAGSDDVAVNSDPSDDVWVPDTATNHLDGSLRWAFSAASPVMTGNPTDDNADEWYEFNVSRWQHPPVALNHLPNTLRGQAGDNGSVQPTITSGYAEYVLQPFDVGQAALDAAVNSAELPASKNTIRMGTVRGASSALEASFADRTVMLVTPKKYSNINVLMAGASGMTGKRAWFRVVALYQGTSGLDEQVVFETPYSVYATLPYGGDETNRANQVALGVPSTTFGGAVPVLSGIDGDTDYDNDGNNDLSPVVVGWKHYAVSGNGDTTPFYSSAGSLAAGSYYRFWELDSDGVPVDETKTLAGLRFEVDNGPNYWMTGYPEGDTVRVYAVSGTVAPPAGELLITDVAIDQAFVYQNAVNSTGDDDTASTGHRATMTVTVDDTIGNSAYTMTVTQSNTGVVRVFAGVTDLAKVLKGSFRTDGTTGTGTCDLHIEIAGDVSGTDSADTSIVVRKLGDIDGNAAVTTADQVELTKRLNNLVTGTYLYDLDANGSVTTADQVLLTKILNNLTID